MCSGADPELNFGRGYFLIFSREKFVNTTLIPKISDGKILDALFSDRKFWTTLQRFRNISDNNFRQMHMVY